MNIEEPKIPRLRKAPKHFESQSALHQFNSPSDYFRKDFFLIIDLALTFLTDRFHSETTEFLNTLFFIKNCEDEVAVSFYKFDHFEKELLLLQRDIIVNSIKTKVGYFPKSFSDIVTFMRNNLNTVTLVPDLFKLVKIKLTIPVSSATCDRSFSVLIRRLRNWLRNTMVAERLNHASLIHIHRRNIALEPLINNFIHKKNN